MEIVLIGHLGDGFDAKDFLLKWEVRRKSVAKNCIAHKGTISQIVVPAVIQCLGVKLARRQAIIVPIKLRQIIFLGFDWGWIYNQS